MFEDGNYTEIEKISVYEPIPLFTKAHWRPFHDFVEATQPNNALVDVKIFPYSTFRPTKVMLDNGYLDSEGMQHVFVSCYHGFEEEYEGRTDFNTRKSAMVDIFSRSRKGDLELVNAWCEFTPGKNLDGQISIDYLIYKYQSGALDYLSAVNGDGTDEIPASRSVSIKKKSQVLREWLSKPKSELKHYHHYRSIGSGMLTEIWMTDFLNFNLKKLGLENYRFVNAPQELDASVPGESSGGDILLLRKDEGIERPVVLIDAKLEKSTRRVPNSGFNRIAGSPKISFPIGDVEFNFENHDNLARHYIYYLRRNIRKYDSENPFLGLSAEASSEANQRLIDKFLMFISNAKVKFSSRIQSPPDIDDREFLGVNIQEQVHKIEEFEDIVRQMIAA